MEFVAIGDQRQPEAGMRLPGNRDQAHGVTHLRPAQGVTLFMRMA
jgi:hypothetical protein